MIVEIYADVVFLINFVFNGAILYVAGVLRRKGARVWRVALGGAVSALFYTLALFTPAAGFFNIFTSFVLLAPGIYAAFAPKNAWDFFLTLLTAYISAFAMGGVAMAGMYAFGPQDVWSTYGFAMRHFGLQNLVVAIVTCFVILKFAQRRIFAKSMMRQAFCSCKIYLRDGVVQVDALVDTGMSLIDPISQNPVIIAEFETIRPLLPPPVARLYAGNNQDDLAAIASSFEEGDLARRLRMIPYSAIGKSGVLAGFKPDCIEIVQGKGGVQVKTNDVIIGICDFALSKDGEYQALMNPQLI